MILTASQRAQLEALARAAFDAGGGCPYCSAAGDPEPDLDHHEPACRVAAAKRALRTDRSMTAAATQFAEAVAALLPEASTAGTATDRVAQVARAAAIAMEVTTSLSWIADPDRVTPALVSAARTLLRASREVVQAIVDVDPGGTRSRLFEEIEAALSGSANTASTAMTFGRDDGQSFHIAFGTVERHPMSDPSRPEYFIAHGIQDTATFEPCPVDPGPPWAVVVYDDTGMYLLEAHSRVHDATDIQSGSSTDAEPWFSDSPPEPGVWYWSGKIRWYPGSYECPEDGDIVLEGEWTRMTARELIYGEKPAALVEDDAKETT